MSIDHRLKYPAATLEERDRVARDGGYRERVQYDLVNRASYAFGLLAAADIAKFCGLDRVTAIEFGVAEGAGLLNLCDLAAETEKETGVAFDIIGFDTGAGLPDLLDHRDHPEIWAPGDFGGVDKQALEAALPGNARMVWGDIRETIEPALHSFTKDAPIGFVSMDMDLYSSTLAAMKCFEAPADAVLPVTIAYFDDTVGNPGRIGSLFRNRWCGQLAAIEEFNEAHEHRKIDQLYTLKARRPLNSEIWLDQMYGVHALDHPLRQTQSQLREALKMADHFETDRMAWPL